MYYCCCPSIGMNALSGDLMKIIEHIEEINGVLDETYFI